MEDKDARLLNGLALAYMGDAVYEVYIREYLLDKGDTKPNFLHHKATDYVSAKAQAGLVQQMLDESLLTDEEITYFKRGRNAKSHSKAKNADRSTYSKSTGFESLFGYLYLTKQVDRLAEIVQWCIKQVDKTEE